MQGMGYRPGISEARYFEIPQTINQSLVYLVFRPHENLISR